jgi:transketolase
MTLTPGVDMSSGSLGQGLSPGVGMALGARLRGLPFRTWVLLGDGEIQEGQVWEAAEVAARYALDNLIAIVDYNGLPQFTWPDFGERGRERPTTNLPAKWEAFGWRVLEADGHDVESLLAACASAQEAADRPCVIIAHTVKGKGVSFMENNYLWHARAPSKEELQRALLELGEEP